MDAYLSPYLVCDVIVTFGEIALHEGVSFPDFLGMYTMGGEL